MRIWNQLYDAIKNTKHAKVLALALIALGLSLVLLVVLVMATVPGPSARTGKELSSAFDVRPVDVDDLFLEDEPDMLPELRLSREPRSFWTLDDAQEFWRSIPDSDIDYWQHLADKTIDNMLEAVP